MEFKTKLFFAFSSMLMALPSTLWAMDDDYAAPDYDEIVPGISAHTGRIYNLVPSHGRDSWAWVNTNESPKFLTASLDLLPPSVQIGDKVHYIHDQKKLGSCTGQSLTQAMEMNLTGDDYRALSPLFVYYNERAKEGTINKDSGASLSDGIQVVAQFGACSEILWPYDDYLNTYKLKPTTECYEDGLKSVVLNYTHVTHTLEDMKTALSGGNPVVGGIAVFESFESEEATQTGIIPMPKRNEKLLGGHAITFTGYDDEEKQLTFVNSWTDQWGQGGFGKLPYAYFLNSKLTMPTEIWSINAVGPKTSN